ncbi:MAG TPA: outer membrane beta-barrel protein [Saprospiraceae bacterium]|nr:outer membrane beta-barrel protein [Saprospiraceae bacterium]
MKNTRIFCFFALLYLCSLTASMAQPTPVFGFDLAPVSARYKISEGFRINGVPYFSRPLLSYSVGLMGGLRFGDRIALVLNPSFTQLGSIYETEGDDRALSYTDKSGKQTDFTGYASFKEKYTSLRIPLLLQVTALKFGERFGITVGAGAAYNVHFKGKQDLVYTDVVNNEVYTDDPTDLKFGGRQAIYVKNTPSLLVSPGLYYQLDEDGGFRLTFESRFEIGAKDLIHSSTRSRVDVDGTLKQNATYFKVGLVICPGCVF